MQSFKGEIHGLAWTLNYRNEIRRGKTLRAEQKQGRGEVREAPGRGIWTGLNIQSKLHWEQDTQTKTKMKICLPRSNQWGGREPGNFGTGKAIPLVGLVFKHWAPRSLLVNNFVS